MQDGKRSTQQQAMVMSVLYLSEVHEVLEACVQMRLLTQAAYAPKMGVIDVSIYPEEALEHCAHHVYKIWRERDTILLGEDPGVVHL